MKLKPDHRSRPIWIAPDAHIHLEAHSPVYAREFLIAIAEPLCRPEFIHEHQITAYSLYAAVSIGLVTNDIIEYLERLSKTTLPDGIKEFIKLCTLSYGKLLNDSVIQAALVDENTRTNIDNQVYKMANMTTTLLNTAPEQTVTTEPPADEEVPKDFADFYTNVIDNHDEDNDADALRNLQILSFEIKQEHLEIVQRKCIELEYPLLAEYDLVLLYEESMRYISNHEWVLLLFGEVHTIPAKMFRRVLTIVQSHCKLGLTTTLVIDDDKDTDLNFLIGPKLYEANKMELQTDGHIAEVQCADVRCAMTGEFFAYYLTLNISRRLLLAVMNPNKMRTCQFLVEYHKARGHKIIIFSDNVGALKRYAMEMKIPFLYGETSQMIILQNFQYNPKVSTILVSKVANTSFDLPEANVLIQVSSHGASRRQKAQRLGRTLLAKKNTNDEFNAYFYSLVSSDTIEMTYSRKRQQFLNNQGYSYKIVVVMVQ